MNWFEKRKIIKRNKQEKLLIYLKGNKDTCSVCRYCKSTPTERGRSVSCKLSHRNIYTTDICDNYDLKKKYKKLLTGGN